MTHLILKLSISAIEHTFDSQADCMIVGGNITHLPAGTKSSQPPIIVSPVSCQQTSQKILSKRWLTPSQAKRACHKVAWACVMLLEEWGLIVICSVIMVCQLHVQESLKPHVQCQIQLACAQQNFCDEEHNQHEAGTASKC